jgi:spermidine synthase
MIYLLVIGLVSILEQAALLRELNVAFYGVELIYILAFGIWLIWTALGVWIGSKNPAPSPTRIQLLFLAASLLLPADLAFIRAIRLLFSEVPGAYLPFSTQMLALSAALLPAGLPSGLIFQWAAQHHISRGNSFASAYALESAGGLAGGLCATLLLRFGLQNLTIVLLCSAFALLAAFAGSGMKSRWFRAAAAGSSAIVLLLFWHAGPIDRALTAWTHQGLLDSRDTPYGRVTITQESGQVAVYENDALAFETEGTGPEVFVHLAALLHPRPARVLILGGGVEGTVAEILKHAPERVDYVELNPVMLAKVAPQLPAILRDSLSAPSVHITIADARRFLRAPDLFDLILIGMPEPASGQANRYYTSEFFAQCAARLRPGGIVSFRLKSAENRWTAPQTGRAVSIYRALKAALPEVQVLPGETNVFAASRQPLPRDPALLASRMEARALTTRLVSAPYLRYLYTNDRYGQIARILESGSVPPNSDARPICYQYTLMIWLSKFYPGLASMDISKLEWWRRAYGPFGWAALSLLAALFILCRRRPALRRALFVGTAAFTGMVLETLIVLYYQLKSGILYQDIGLLLTGFMAGSALGAWFTDWWVRIRGRCLQLWFGFFIGAAFAALGLVAHFGMSSGWIAGLAQNAVLLILTGGLVAATLGYAAFAESGDQRKLVAPLYMADLAGGCLGSLMGSLLLIPSAGLAGTALAMAFGAPLLLVLLPYRGSAAQSRIR